MSALASGLRVHVEGDDVSDILRALRASVLLAVQWDREGPAIGLSEELSREARMAKADVWLLLESHQPMAERVREIREREGAVPILVLSRTREEGDEAQALEAGADSFCRWPEDVGVLPSRIHALLRRASGTFRIALQPQIELIADACELRLGDRVVKLSPPEQRLLRRLDEARNHWVSHDALWVALGYNGSPPHDSSLIRTHLMRLRRKLGSFRWALRTERGHGTMLTDGLR